MSYSFQPMSDEELESINLVPEGVYSFEVLRSTRKISKSGNPMAELQLGIYDDSGVMRAIFDYLVFSTVPLNIKKVSHFCKSVGLEEEYKKGSIREELEGLTGKVKIGIQEEVPNPKGGFYHKKNSVIDYILTKEDKIKTKKENDEKQFSDDIPF